MSGKLNEISKSINEKLFDINAEYASTDKNGNFLHEEVVTIDKNGTTKKENTGNFKYTLEREKEKRKAMEHFWNQEVEIPSNIIERNEKNSTLYKQIIEKNTLTTLTDLAGVLLDFPIDKDGFIDEEFVLNFLSINSKEKQNGTVQEKTFC